MPRRPDGRIEPGQRLASAISARAWNRAQDAADIVLGERTGFEAGPRISKGLPQMRITLPQKGFFGQVRRPSRISPINQLMPVSTQSSLFTIWNYSDNEKLLPVFGEVISGQFGSGVFWVDDIVDALNNFDGSIAICVDNDSREYAVGGMAITRVRVFNYLHRCARFATQIPDGNSFQNQNAIARGSLDSSFHGPVKIIGFASVNNAGQVQFGLPDLPELTWPNYVFRWALVRF